MSFSEVSALVRMEEAQHLAEDPVDTLRARVIANNLDHLADQSAQVLVNWAVADGAGIQRATQAAGAVASALWQSPAFPLRFRPDGQSYRIRLRLRGRALTNGVAFWVALEGAGPGATHSTQWVRESRAAGTFAAPVEAFETVSSTGAWLAPENDGWVYRLDSRDSRVVVDSLDELSGLAVAHETSMARISVYAYRLTSSPTAELTGLYAAEYVGT